MGMGRSSARGRSAVRPRGRRAASRGGASGRGARWGQGGGRAAVAVAVAAVVAVAAIAAGIAGVASAGPIPSLAIPPPPSYLGAPAVARPILGVAPIPQNRYMAPNGRSEIHDDGYQTDAYSGAGPLGRAPVATSSALTPQRDCGSITFDSHGRLVAVCVGASGPELYMFDPATLNTLATYSLPMRQSLPSNIFQDYTGGGYYYLDQYDRVVVSTTTHHILVIEETGGPGFRQLRDYDLSGVLTSGENITSALPDSSGLLWFVTKSDGIVGTLNFKTGAIHTVRMGNGTAVEIENSFASDQHGAVYIATNRKLYRFGTGRGGVPRVVWSVSYPNSGVHKPGQVDDGTGTTPTVMLGGAYVNITDNADPMDVVVYRTGARLRRGERREVCRVPVFARGASADENSIIVAGGAMIAENNYGYKDPSAVTGGQVTSPGFARVDLLPGGRGCRKVWENDTESAPTVVTKLSLATGLIYTYTKEPGSSDPWYWTALDFRTGRVVWKVYAGSGLGFNNNYAGIALGPNHEEYLGALGGVLALRDGP